MLCQQHVFPPNLNDVSHILNLIVALRAQKIGVPFIMLRFLQASLTYVSSSEDVTDVREDEFFPHF